MKHLYIILFFFISSITYANSNIVNTKITSVWIFCGQSGDSQNLTKFQNKIETIKKALINQYHIDSKNLHIYFNLGGLSYESCKKSDMLSAFESINKSTKRGEHGLVLFLGHANSMPKDINYNLPGEDLSIKELAKKINRTVTSGKLGIIWAVESGERAVKLLKNKNLVILAAAETEDRDNEPVLNEIIETLFNKNLVDLNKDGTVDFTEMQIIAKNAVKQWYAIKKLIQLEKIILDGDGNGIGTAAPSPVDKQESKKITLNY